MAMLPRWATEGSISRLATTTAIQNWRAGVSTAFAISALSLLLVPALAVPETIPYEAISEKPPPERVLLLKRMVTEREGSPDVAGLRLLLGRAFLDDGKSAEAVAVLSHKSLASHPLREWALRWQLEALAATTARLPEREPLLEALFTAPGEASFRIESARELADIRISNGRLSQAIEPLEAVLRANPLDVAVASRLASSCARSHQGERAKALALWLYTEMPAKAETKAFFTEDPARRSWVASLTAEQRLRRLLRLDAASAFADLSAEQPFSSASSEAEANWAPYFKARLDARQQPPALALKQYLALQGPPEVRQAALRQLPALLTSSLLSRSDFEKGTRALDGGLSLGEERERSFLLLHRWCLKQGDPTGATYFAVKALRPETESFVAAEFLYRSAWEARLAGKATLANGLCEDLAQNLSPSNEYRQAALYTLLLMDHLSEPKATEAREELLRTSKYGYFGYQLRSGAPPTTTAVNTMDLSAPPEPLVQGTHRQKAALLGALALWGEAAPELVRALPENPLPWQHLELAGVWAKANVFPSSVIAARRAFPDAYSTGGDSLPPEAWRLLYPLPYRGPLQKASEATGLPVDLLAAVARQESLWDRMALSRAGAVGLMQLLPSTAREVSRKSGMPLPTEERLRDPEWNLPAGANYLKRMLERCGNDIPIALASYNAGPGNADKWRARANNPTDPRLFTESIPFRETRLYIRRITLYRHEYQRIYPDLLAGSPSR